MKVLVQWATKTPSDWIETDSALAATLPRKVKPKTGARPTNETPGWVAAINVQGVVVEGYDAYGIETLADGRVRITGWDGTTAVEVIANGLAPDPLFGGAINTRQEVRHYGTPGGPAYSQFVPAALPFYGIWQDNFAAFQAARTLRAWREWVEGVPLSLVEDGKVVDQRSLGRYNIPDGTRTYFQRTAARAVGWGNYTNEVSLETTNGSGDGTQSLGQTVPTGTLGTFLAFSWAGPENQPNSAAWPLGDYRLQVDVSAAGANLLYKPINVRRLQANLGSEEAQPFVGVEASGTGLKLFTITVAAWTAGLATDRVGWDLQVRPNMTLMSPQSLTLFMGDNDAFADGPWPAPDELGEAALTSTSATFAAAGRVDRAGAAALTNPAATMAAAPVADRAGAVAMTSASASLTAVGSRDRTGAVAMTNVAGTFAAVGSVDRNAQAALTSAVATFAADGMKSGTQAGEATLTATATLTASAVRDRAGAAVMSADASLAGAGVADRTGAVAMTSVAATFAATGSRDKNGVAALTNAAATFTATPTADRTAQAALSASATMAGAGTKDALGSAAMTSAAGTLAGTGRMDRAGLAALIGDGSFLAAGELIAIGSGRQRIMLPKVAVTITSPEGVDMPSQIEDWESREAVGLGMIAWAGKLDAAHVHRLPHIYRDGARVEVADTADGTVVFSGRLLEPAPTGDGKYQLAAEGDGVVRLEEQAGWLIYRDDGTENWSVADAEPHNYVHSDPNSPRSQKISVALEGRNVEWEVAKGTKFDGGEGMAAIYWAADEPLRRLAFTPKLEDDVGTSATHYRWEVLAGTGPDGDLTLIQSWNCDAVTLGEEILLNLPDEYDQIAFLLRRKAGHARKTSKAFRAWASVKVSSLTKDDDFTTSDLARDLGARAGLRVKVEDSETNALPRVYDEGTFSDALIDLAVEDGIRVGVWNDGRGPVLHYLPWGRDTYYVEEADAQVDLLPVPRYDRVRVPYMARGGVKQWVVIDAERQVFPDGEHRTMTIDLSRPGTKDQAKRLGAKVVAYVSRLRWGGSARIRFVRDEHGRRVPAHKVRAGSELVLVTRKGITVRVADVSRRRSEVTANFDDSFALLDAWLAKIERKGFRGRPSAGRSKKGHSGGRPAAPGTPTIAFVKADVKGRVDWRAIVDWVKVTTDTDGNPAAISSYEVELQPVNAGGVKQDEARRAVVGEKEDEDTDPDADFTKKVFHNVEKPRTWYQRARVRAVDTKGRKGPWSSWTGAFQPVDSYTPAAPTNLFWDVDAHKMRARWDPDLDPADSDLIRPEIDYYQARVFTTNVGQGGTWAGTWADGRGVQIHDRKVAGDHKTWKVSKPGNGTFWVQVRSVATNGAKSAWVLASGNRLAPPSPAGAPTITVEGGGKERVRIRVSGSYAGVYADDDVDHVTVRLTDNGRYRWHTIDLEPDQPSGSWETTFKGVKEGHSISAAFRVVDGKGQKSGFSPSASLTAYDPATPPSPTTPSVQTGLRKIIVYGYGTSGDRSEVDHYQIELRRSSDGALMESDYHHVGTRKTFERPEYGTNFYALVRSVGPGGNGSGWISSASASPQKVQSTDIEDQAIQQTHLPINSVIRNRWGETGSYLGGNWFSPTDTDLQNVGTLTGKFRSASAGARVVLGHEGEGNSDRLKFYSGTGLTAYMTAIGSDLYQSGDLRTEGLCVGASFQGGVAAGFVRIYKDGVTLKARDPNGVIRTLATF